MMIRWIVRLALLMAVAFLAPIQVSAQSGCLQLRTFTPEERKHFETRYGIEWWKVMGLIPGPTQPGDWVERPWGDSSTTIYMPQVFWDPWPCARTAK